MIFAQKIFLPKLVFLALIVAAQCTLNSLKAQLRFVYCPLGLQIVFFFCSAPLSAHLCHLAYVGDGRVQRFDFTWWKGALASPPPHHRLGSARWLSYAHLIFHYIFKIKFQIKISNTF